jgi:ribosome production factor 1
MLIALPFPSQKVKRIERKKRKKAYEEAEREGLEPPPKAIPKTVENTRAKDETVVTGADDEVEADEADDEFAAHFNNERPPKVLLTTCYRPSKVMYTFLSEMLEVFPSAQYYKRAGFPLKKIVEFASKRDYTDVVVFNEDRKQVNAMLVVHLPDGPTARFRLSNLVLGKDIKGHGRATEHKPELILNNFGTRLGRRVGRMFASLFCQDPTFRGRRAVTFHNQRDFIFFRHHRYVFEEKEKKASSKAKEGPKKVVQARLQELGPRFTLKLEAVQKGTFNSKEGEFEWLRKAEAEKGRKNFFL